MGSGGRHGGGSDADARYQISQQRRRNADRNSTVEIESFEHHM